jgi:hypothetical protein
VRLRAKLVAAAAAVLFATFAIAAERVPTGDFTHEQVTQAVGEVKKDPNLAGRTIRTLRWANQKRPTEAGSLRWLRDMMAWIGQGGRFLFWIVLAFLVGVLLVYLWRLVRNWSPPERSKRIDAPSFVRDLDIRPESLPADIGAAARQLWDSGEHRSALALLYRGLLSRLVHVHHVPIKDSSTEGDCLALAHLHLKDEERRTYVASLVRLWQRAVYGGENVQTESVHALCDGFAHALDQPEVTESAAGASPAGAGA